MHMAYIHYSLRCTENKETKVIYRNLFTFINRFLRGTHDNDESETLTFLNGANKSFLEMKIIIKKTLKRI